MLKKIWIFILLIGIAHSTLSQSLPVGSVALEDYYRREQLLGKLDSSISFTIRPLHQPGSLSFSSLLYPDSANRKSDLLITGQNEWKAKNGKISARLLPFTFNLQLNTHHPTGWNDGAMIPSKGLQSLISGGVYAQTGPLSIQLKPELVLAANNPFDGFSKDHYEVIWARYYDQYNYIDLPERFGTDNYSRIFWGQSNIRLTFDPVSFGISSENLWWGPGRRSSLLMSNNATGFKHLTFNTVRPVKTPLGSIEGQLVAGRLEGSGFNPLTPDLQYFGAPLTLTKPDDWRYFSGLAFTWQPKWVPGLFLGFTRSKQAYSKNMGNGLGAYLPLFAQAQRYSAAKNPDQHDQYSSMFMRWVWPEEQAEIYFEYGRNNQQNTLRNTLLEPENSRAYLFGMTKVFDFRGTADENIEVNLEVTQLQQTNVGTVLSADAWYVSKNIPHGYTNRGEVLGAGIGPGGSLQSVDVSWIKGIKRFGLQVERYVHNNDFYYYAYVDSQDWRRHWVDLSLAGNAEWSYQNLIFHTRVQATQSLNYQWFLLQTNFDQYFANGRDKFNVRANLGLTYRF